MRIVSVFLALLFCCAQPVFAEPKTFTIRSGDKYSVNVPAGWSSQEYTDGIQITQDDKKASFSLSLYDNPEGISLKELQQSTLSRLNLTDIKKTEEKNVTTIYATSKNIRFTIIFRQQKTMIITIVAAGCEKKQIDALLASLRKEKKEDEQKEENGG